MIAKAAAPKGLNHSPLRSWLVVSRRAVTVCGVLDTVRDAVFCKLLQFQL